MGGVRITYLGYVRGWDAWNLRADYEGISIRSTIPASDIQFGERECAEHAILTLARLQRERVSV